MYCKLRRKQFGEFRNKMYRRKKFEYLDNKRMQGWNPKCTECGIQMNKRYNSSRRQTIDHVIPLWVCREYSMPELEFNSRNFRIICSKCNQVRGYRETSWDDLDLSPEVKEKILNNHQKWLETRLQISEGGIQ